MTDATQYLLVVARLTASTDEPVGSGPVGDVLSLDDPTPRRSNCRGRWVRW